MNYYLRIAGTNFDSFITDTKDLNTIRGGSLLLREAIDQVTGLDPVSTGASEGLFRFEAADDNEAESRRYEIEGGLRQKVPALRHATFVVDVTRDTGDFRRDKEKAIALNRWRQMQSLSLAVPSPAGEGARPCALDLLRPASGHFRKFEDPISESAYVRREHGRDRKQDFYERETRDESGAGISIAAGYCDNLEALASDPDHGNLDGKMAVLYIDGNAFGAVQERHVRSVADQRDFDGELQSARRAVLRALVVEAATLPAMREGPDGPIRLETLMWGGDEMAWVLPAWAGLWAVDLFFRHADRFRFRGETLRHAAGLVLCHHKAPIHRMRALAEALADLAKDADRGRDLLAYEVLESFDDVGDDLAMHREIHCPEELDPKALLLDPEKIGEAVTAYDSLRPHLPARQLHMAVDALFRGDEEALAKATQRLRAALAPMQGGETLAEPNDLAAYDRLIQALGGAGKNAAHAGLLHLVALDEYLASLGATARKEDRHV